MPKIRKLFCHEIDSYPQPLPTKNDGGDCFACALLSALRWLYPERNFTFEEIEKKFWIEYQVDTYNNGVPYSMLSNYWSGYKQVFQKVLEDFNLVDFKFRYYFEAPKFDNTNYYYAWNRCQQQYNRYWSSLSDVLHSGGVVYTSINLDGDGPWKDGKWNILDHVVLFDGVREHEVPFKDGIGSRICQEIHVVCSAKGNSWKDVHELIDLYGAGAWYILERNNG